MNIEKLHGTSTRLYQLVAPLVMSPPVLRQNNNYPFKTSDHHVWFVALEEEKVRGFMPVEVKDSCVCIDNRVKIPRCYPCLPGKRSTNFPGKNPCT